MTVVGSLQAGERVPARLAFRQGKLTDEDPVILQSARKHQVPDDDMLHAYRHPIRVFDSTTSRC